MENSASMYYRVFMLTINLGYLLYLMIALSEFTHVWQYQKYADSSARKVYKDNMINSIN